jgi:hypothetical protein
MSIIHESPTTATPESFTTTCNAPSLSSLTSPQSQTSVESRDPLATATSSLSLHAREPESALITMPPPKFGYIDWMSTRIQSDSACASSTREEQPDSPARRYLDSFFDNFHHRWGLIHRPSFEENRNETPLIAAMRMIGAWLYGTQESRDYALAVHERLLENNITRLVSQLDNV